MDGEVQYVEAAYRHDGTLSGLRVRYYTDLGAYCNGGSHAVVGMLHALRRHGVSPGPRCGLDHPRCLYQQGASWPYRGYGQHATAYVIERVMDLIAHALQWTRRGATEEFHCSGCVSLSDAHGAGV